jgi:glutamine synthetase
MAVYSKSQPIATFFDEHGIREVECIFPDINGFPRGKIMRADDFAAGKAMAMAEAVALHSVTGDFPDDDICGHADQDVHLVPDLSTLRTLPWAPGRSVAIHDCLGFDGQPSHFAPRSVLKKVLARYRAQGLSPVVAPEVEFYLFDRDGQYEQGFKLPRQRGGGSEVFQSAFSLEAAAEMAPFWSELNQACVELGLRTDTWLHEMGASQFEINLLHGEALALADAVVLFKYALREVAARHGMVAVFMAKPVAGQPGSSMHLHQSIVDADGNNVFSNAEGGPSERFFSFIGGLQQHLSDFMPCFAPNINSWRRYVAGSLAPVTLDWAENNRTVALRVPQSAPAARRVENRLPGSDANPYLAMAASLACGLIGMDDGLAARAPIENSGYDRERELPASFEQAIDRLKNSAVARAALGDAFVTAYCGVKQMEYNHYMAEISAWDRRYLTMQT